MPEVVRAALEKASPAQKDAIHSLLNDLTVFVQKHQREAGNTFVSRTTLKPEPLERRETRVFRVVLANPLTTHAILQEVLVEQREIAKRSTIAYPELLTLANSIVTA